MRRVLHALFAYNNAMGADYAYDEEEDFVAKCVELRNISVPADPEEELSYDARDYFFNCELILSAANAIERLRPIIESGTLDTAPTEHLQRTLVVHILALETGVESLICRINKILHPVEGHLRKAEGT